MSNVTIVDYGFGNIMSVANAFNFLGAKVTITNDPKKISTSERIILPGVGTFIAGMQALSNLNILDHIKLLEEKGVPILGICLGMQLLMDTGFEDGETKGLGLIRGEVRPIESLQDQPCQIKVPHIGWADLIKYRRKEGGNEIIHENELSGPMYFVHSYAVDLADNENLVANSSYMGIIFPSIISKNLVYGCQFHPEKSGKNGLRFLSNFLKI